MKCRDAGAARGMVVLILLGAACFSSPTRAEGNWAESLFSERGVNFGAVPRGSKVRHPFVLTNRLNEPVTILDIRASCGCTSGRASASTVPPGGTAVIEAEMDTRNFVGNKATTLTVSLMTASGAHGEMKFGVQSNILADIVLNPGTADFGVMARGQSPSQVITIERLGRPDWKFTRMVASEAFCRVIDAKLDETYRTGQGVGYTLSIRVKPDAPAGVVRDEVRLMTNDPESPSVPVLVTAQVQGALSATPSVLSMGQVASSGKVQGRYILRGTQPFTIASIEGNGEGFTLAAPDATPKAVHLLTLTYDPEQGKARGDLRRTFRVTTSLAGEGPIELSATLRVAP